MKALLTTLIWEAKSNVDRDCVFFAVLTLLTYFELFSDFPFQPQEPVDFGPETQFIMVMLMWCVLLAVFNRSISRDLDNKLFLNQHPVNYPIHFLGKFLHIFLVFLAVTVMESGLLLWRMQQYAGSLNPPDYSELTQSFVSGIYQNLFIAGLIVLVSVFRPFHYLLLIVLLSSIHLLIRNQPDLADILPTLSLDQSIQRPLLIYGIVFYFLGAIIYAWKMYQHPKIKSRSRLTLDRWLDKLYIKKWAPLTLTLLVTGTRVNILHNDNAAEQSISPLRQAQQRLQESLEQLSRQKHNETRYFSFSYEKKDQWIYETLATQADPLWQQIYQEFGLDFNAEHNKIDVFIKPSQLHQLGSTRGASVIINADPLYRNEQHSADSLLATFRHELTHVLINELSNYQFLVEHDILNGFLHEGLATLVQNHWNTNQSQLIKQAALDFHTHDLPLFELLPKIGFFDEYDYLMNYSLGYVFWSEFVKQYNRRKVTEFLVALGRNDPEDYQYQGLWYLFHKAELQDINLYQVFYALRRKVQQAYTEINPGDKAIALTLKNFKTARMDGNELLIPYQFLPQHFASCHFRPKDSLFIETQAMATRYFSGRQAGICALPKAKQDEIKVTIRLHDGLWFDSKWIAVPDNHPL